MALSYSSVNAFLCTAPGEYSELQSAGLSAGAQSAMRFSTNEMSRPRLHEGSLKLCDLSSHTGPSDRATRDATKELTAVDS